MKITQSDTKKTILRALDKYTSLILPTYGPAGKKVLIATNEFSLKAADDGHAVSAEFEIENEFENAVIMYIREATSKTNSRVGDGTTTAVVLTNAIVSQVIPKEDDPFASTNFHKEAQEIQRATLEAVQYIKDSSQKIETADELYKIAYNSYNNEKIARLIADTIFKIGKDGVLAIEDSHSTDTEVEIVEGVQIDKGYASPYLINNDKDEVVLNEPRFLLVNSNLDRFMDVVPALKLLFENGRKDFVIMADSFGEDFLGQMIMNKIKGSFSPLLVINPGFGDGRTETLKNIASVVGATIFDKNTKLEMATLEDFGEAKKIVAKKDKTTIMGGNEAKIGMRIGALQVQLEEATQEFTKEKLKKDIASLKGGIALIKIGANTDNEQKSIKMKVEDAVNATKVAFQDGVVAGGGKTFGAITTSSKILNEALKAPRKLLEENGKEMLDEDVTDPAGVLIAALETASSIACGLLTMGGIIATKRKEEKE